MDPMAAIDKYKVETSVDDLLRQRNRLETHVDLLEEKRFQFEFLQLDLGRRVAATLIALVDEAATYDDDQRATLRAAIDYFVMTEDEEHDLTSPIGLEDDAEITNAVCDLLGRPELKTPPR